MAGNLLDQSRLSYGDNLDISRRISNAPILVVEASPGSAQPKNHRRNDAEICVAKRETEINQGEMDV